MSIRKSLREHRPPVKYTPNGSESDDIIKPMVKSKEIHGDRQSLRTSSSTSSRRRMMETELLRLEELNRMEKEFEESEMERQKEERELERQKEERELKRELERQKEERELERQKEERELKRELERQKDARELERQKEVKELERQKKIRELERQKRLLKARISLENESSRNSHTSSVSMVSLDLNEHRLSKSKVETWLNEKQPPAKISTSAIVSTTVQKIADSFEKVLQPLHDNSVQKNFLDKKLPNFSGKPDEWPIFYSTFEKTMNSFSEDDNLVRLRNSLEGDAFKMVRPLFVSGRNVSSIIKTLQMRFGRPEFIIESMLQKTKSIVPVREDEITSLVEFSTNVLNFTATAESLNMEHYMTNPLLLSELLGKLPYSLKYSWAQHIRHTNLTKPDLKDFSIWLEDQCSMMSIYFRQPEDNKTKQKTEFRHIYTNAVKGDSCHCTFCRGDHENERCSLLRKADVSNRWKMVIDKKLCFFCFRQHQLKLCKVKKTCGIKGCKLFHHRLLHTDNMSKDFTHQEKKEIISNHNEENISNQVLLRVCPVTLYGPESKIDTYALLDDGSTVTLLDSSIADELGLEGKTKPLTTYWSNETKNVDPTSREVSLKIQGYYENELFELKNLRTQSGLQLPLQNVDTIKLKKRWQHLNSLDQPLPKAHAKPTILIGQDNCNLILPRKVIEGPSNAPVLSWSYLGWTLHGKCSRHKDRIDNEFTLTAFQRDDLHEMIRTSFQIDNYGGKPQNIRSPEEKRAVTILENTTKKVGDHYEVGLLWKSDTFKFPPSYGNALKRLNNIEKKMDKEPLFKTQYSKKIDEYVNKGYVRKLTKKEADTYTDKTFYIPHFGVVNPNKPDKLRLVFDAAAKTHGVSFNDALLSGPDYLNSLPSVLLKFRMRKIGIVGDIKEMFHQVRIRKEDVDSQRFLWRNEQTKEVETYVMEAMTFGSTCSPCAALFVVNLNATLFSSIYPEASHSILKKEYMDDLLDSTNTEEEAKCRIKEICDIHNAGGFQICNWLSNSKSIIKELPDELKTNSTRQLSIGKDLPTERVLGMWWNAESDMLVFYQYCNKLKLTELHYPTKREILKAAMSIFDPLGLVTPVTIKGRLIIQDVWRIRLEWDEVLPDTLCKIWQDWIHEIHNLQCLQVNRCYFTTTIEEGVELHIFVDASQEAFAAAAYLRVESEDKIETTLIMARAKVAPLKSITIPRMELQAAVLGCRIAKQIQDDIDVPILHRVFWSDSVTVLHWIRSESNNFKQFVANRIGEIQESSTTKEWKWVPTNNNPADIATRRKKFKNSIIPREWFCGPSFLSLKSNQWPEQPSTLQSNVNEENKKCFTGFHTIKNKLIEVSNFSSWEKLTRVLAWTMKFVKILKDRINSPAQERSKYKNATYPIFSELCPEDIMDAEHYLFRMSQLESFNEDYYFLEKGKSLPKSSPIYNLTPFLDEKNIIRMSSRLCYSPELNSDQKRPIILHGNNETTRLLIKMIHEKFFHQSVESVINESRKRFWIINLRTTVKKVKYNCVICKIKHAKPSPPQMAPLPLNRVTKVQHPFFYTGVDYFGPVEVTVGRRHEKRWGVLFTCLSTRAIHLEVAHSLNTESCIMAIQRFVSRRPYPSEMFSDNGTNFVASEKELKEAVRSLDHVQIQQSTVKNGIKWNFIPPRAPHMGGCWERLVRSVKTALRAVMRSQYPRDEEFQTFLTRVEYIINCRPLTHVSVDPEDPEPLTPNHFLQEAFKVNVNEDNLNRRQFARIRNLLDGFWKRWVHEYLPCLTRRCKWHKPSSQPQIGDLAILVEEESPRNTWPLGRITAIHPGYDGQVRVVDIKTNKGLYRRPLTKIAILSLGGKKM